MEKWIKWNEHCRIIVALCLDQRKRGGIIVRLFMG